MSLLTLQVVANGFTVAEPEQILYQALDGGMGRYALDMVGGANRLINATWVCDGDEYEYLVGFFRENIGLDCPPFELAMIIDGAEIHEFDGVQFVEDSFKLASVDAGVFTVQAQLEVPPTDDVDPWLDVDWDTNWPDTPRKLNLHPQKSGYAVNFGSEIISTNENGPVGVYRRSYLNAARRVPVKWLTEAAGYNYLQSAYRNFVMSGGEPFLIDLLMDEQDLTEHRACFVPGSFGLSEQRGDAYTVSAILEVESAPYVGDYVQHTPSNPSTGGLFIGWLDPMDTTYGYGVAAVSNTGFFDVTVGPFPPELIVYMGKVDYAGQTMVWSLDYVTSGFTGFPPTLTDLGGGRAQLSWPNIDYPFNRAYDNGVATLSATVNGVPASNTIIATIADGLYGQLVWGPSTP